jgi:hypothetical protein
VLPEREESSDEARMAEEESIDDVAFGVEGDSDVLVSIGGDDVGLGWGQVKGGDGGGVAEDQGSMRVEGRVGVDVRFPLLVDSGRGRGRGGWRGRSRVKRVTYRGLCKYG